VGLLKLAAYYKKQGHKVKLVRGNVANDGFNPDKIMVTSLFTYWADYVRDTVQHYRKIYPDATISVGGIYASLMPDHCKEYTGCDRVFKGVHKSAEKCKPAYELVDVDYQIIHASRGCIRRCKFCGTWKIEPDFIPKKSIKKEISSNKLIFYDNNLLANPYIKDILKELEKAQYNGRAVYSESQCGFDGRLIQKDPELARLIKKARFQNVRIAWDHSYDQHENIEKQLKILENAGFNMKDLYVFMVYNWDHDFEEMEKKRIKCWEWGVQIADCRYRPLDQTFDYYKPLKKNQTNEEYFIHEKWTDAQVKQFRRNIRRQNICVRHGFPFYSKMLEHKVVSREQTQRLKGESKETVLKEVPDAWFPDVVHFPQIYW